jgi:PilZ domain
MGEGHSESSGCNSSPNERRRSQRYRCQLPVEMQLPGVSFASQGETVDIGLGGCYVSSPFTLPLGTEVALKLWVEQRAVETKATVRTSDPGVGNGFQFQSLSEPDEHALKQYLEKLNVSEQAPADPSLRDQLIL